MATLNLSTGHVYDLRNHWNVDILFLFFLLIGRSATASLDQGLLPETLITKVFLEDVDDPFNLSELFYEFLMMGSALEGISGYYEVSH